MQVLETAKPAPDGGNVLEQDMQEIFLVPAVYRKEAGVDLCKGCGWWKKGTGREHSNVCLQLVS